MLRQILFFFGLIKVGLYATKQSENFFLRYLPNWDSIDSRPIPKWYDEAKIGIFLHWGVYSVPGMHSEWFWWDWQGQPPLNDVKEYMDNNYAPNFKYTEFAKDFKAQFFDPKRWVDIFSKSGAKYVVMTSKHHEGFTMWPSNYSWNWNSHDNGPNMDLVGMLAREIRNDNKLKFGLYYSLFEWFHPLYVKDREANFTTQNYVQAVSYPQIMEIINTYEPELLWLDGDVGPPEYWKSLDILAWLYNESPVKSSIVTNDRWGSGCPCHHGGYFTCQDKYNPGKLMPRKWENCMTIDKNSWGFRRNMNLHDVLTIKDLILTLVETISYGGNILINVGPTADGIIVPIFEERLLQLGEWLEVNGEAIYATQPWKHQKEPFQKIWFTSKVNKEEEIIENAVGNYEYVYAIFMDWPKEEENYMIKLTRVELSNNVTKDSIHISLLGVGSAVNLPWKLDTADHSIIYIDLSKINLFSLPNHIAWTLKFQINLQKDKKDDDLQNDVL